MYGKSFASMYTGSLFGKPAIVFATWGYVIANMRPSRSDGQCYVELNPTLLGAIFSTTVPEIMGALETLEAPDSASRTKADDGRRLVLLDEHRHAGPMQYRVVNGAKYRAIRDEEERRKQNREAKQRQRAHVSNVSHGQPPSAQVEGEVEVKRIVDRSIDDLFSERWSRFPAKVGKEKARSHFRATVKNEIDLARFDRAFTNYMLVLERDAKAFGRKPMGGSRFFGSWRDEEWQEPPAASPSRDAHRPEGLKGVAL